MLSCVELTEADVTELCGEIFELHSKVISATTTHQGINEETPEARGLIEGAVATVFCTHYDVMLCRDFVEQIANLSEKIAKNHAFLDGNKRTAVMVIKHLLEVYYPQCFIDIKDVVLYNAILGVVTGECPISSYVEIIRGAVQERREE